MNIQELAKAMGESEATVTGFVDCLAAWMEKGYTIEGAIMMHSRAMAALAERFRTDVEFRRPILEGIYDELRAQAS